MQGFTVIDLVHFNCLPGSSIVCRTSFREEGNEGEKNISKETALYRGG